MGVVLFIFPFYFSSLRFFAFSHIVDLTVNINLKLPRRRWVGVSHVYIFEFSEASNVLKLKRSTLRTTITFYAVHDALHTKIQPCARGTQSLRARWPQCSFKIRKRIDCIWSIKSFMSENFLCESPNPEWRFFFECPDPAKQCNSNDTIQSILPHGKHHYIKWLF